MNKELVDYIKQQSSDGVSKSKVTEVLLEQGWHQAEIDEAFADAQGVAGGMVQTESSAAVAAGTGGKKSLLIAAVAFLILVLVFAAVASFMGKGEKEEVSSLPESQEAPAAEGLQGETATEGEDQIDPAIIAEISQLEKSITPPAGWIVRQGMVNYRPMAIFFKPEAEKDGNGEKIINEYVNVIRDNLLNNANDYVEKAKTAWQAKNVDYSLVSERKVNLSDGAGAVLLTGSLVQNDAEIKNMQLFVGKGDVMYIISGFVLAKNWDAEKDMIGAAVMSFKFPEY